MGAPRWNSFVIMSTDQWEGSEACSVDLAERGTHVCYFYNDERERGPVIARFAGGGMIAKQKILCVGDPATVRAELISGGASPGAEPAWIFVDPIDVCRGGAVFAFALVMQRYRSLFEAALREGFSGVRGLGCMQWLKRVTETGESPIEYEAGLNDLFKTHPYAAMCYYDVRTIGGEMLFDLLNVHPYIVVGEQIVHNPYFVEPKAFLKRYRARAPCPEP